MRAGMAVVFATILSVSVSAQDRQPEGPHSMGRPSIGLPLSPIGLPLAPIGLPLARIGLSPFPPDRTGVHNTPNVDRPGLSNARDHRRPDRHNAPAIFYVVPPYGWWWDGYLPGSVTPVAPPERKLAKGYLRVELQPSMDAQVYVDGYYVGLLGEFPGGWPLDPGPHVLEVHADGHQSATIDVQIFEGRVATYRGSLTTSPPPAPEPSSRIEPPAPMGPIYFIPGCYLGNVAPQKVTLPPGCDAAAVVTMGGQ